MNRQRDLDTIVSAWLEEGPSRLPHHTRRAITAGTRATPQARGWQGRLARLSGDSRFQSVVAMAGAVTLVLLAVTAIAVLNLPGGGFGGPNPTPSPSPSPSALSTESWSTFVSARHGYTIRHPDDWAVAPATEPWPYGTGIAGGPGNPEALDRFNSDSSLSRIVITSQALPEGVSEGAWIEGYRTPVVQAFGEACFPPPEDWERQVIDGVEIGVYVGCRFVEAVAFAGDRAYTFTLDNTYTDRPDPASRPFYDAMIRSITFDPQAADDSPVGAPPSP